MSLTSKEDKGCSLAGDTIQHIQTGLCEAHCPHLVADTYPWLSGSVIDETHASCLCIVVGMDNPEQFLGD